MTDYSDLSNADIAERTARDVMGWELQDDAMLGDYYCWLCLSGHTGKPGCERWDPVNDARHTQRLIEHANELGIMVIVRHYEDGYTGAEIALTEVDVYRDSAGRAICEAILDAVDQQQD